MHLNLKVISFGCIHASFVFAFQKLNFTVEKSSQKTDLIVTCTSLCTLYQEGCG